MTTDTKLVPKDAELMDLGHECELDAVAFGRAVLARWGQPAHSGEPVAWRVHPFDYGIGSQGVHATTSLPQQRDAWLRKGWKAEPLYTTPQPTQAQAGVVPVWIVNDLGELGVQVNGRCFFLYKGDNIEYGEDDQGEVALHDDGSPMHYRIVGKREFGETCWPLAWILRGRSEDRYTQELVFTPGVSFGNPEDGLWRELPTPHGIKGDEHDEQ